MSQPTQTLPIHSKPAIEELLQSLCDKVLWDGKMWDGKWDGKKKPRGKD